MRAGLPAASIPSARQSSGPSARPEIPAGPYVSSNGGLAWVSGGGIGGLFTNGAMVAALSTQHAFVGGAGSALSVTDNGGRTYQTIAELTGAVWIGFTDSEVGYVITQNQTTQATACGGPPTQVPSGRGFLCRDASIGPRRFSSNHADACATSHWPRR